MLISYNWLQEYFATPLPSPEELVRVISLHAFEVEGVRQVEGDTIIDIDVLPNRSHDALSHDGIARELGVLLEREVVFKTKNEEPSFSKEETKKMVTLSVEKSSSVPRATKRLFTGISVGESPQWLKERLASLGQRSINNVVDITNLVMLETGQPIHAFDFDKIVGDSQKSIMIRGAQAGEKVATLDGEEWELEEGMLVIADEKQALDIAGIKGGRESGIDESTTRVLLSACTFSPELIRKTSRTLGLITDASKRFGQGITPDLVDRAHMRAAEYLYALAGASATEDIVEVYPRPQKTYKIGVSLEEINGKLGTELSKKDVSVIFDRLHFPQTYVGKPKEEVVSLSKTFVDVPYVYGASVSRDCPKSFDCGAFVNYLYVQFGLALPRMVQDQYMFTERITEEQAKAGDVVFSSTGSNGNIEEVTTLGIKQTRQTKGTLEFMPGIVFDESIDHAGIYFGDGLVIHASPKKEKGKVVVEKLSESNLFKKIIGFGRVIGAENGRFVVDVPHERLDLAPQGILTSGNSEDLIEEIGRVYGFYNIEGKSLPVAPTEPTVNKEVYYANKIRDILVADGFYEVMTYSLIEAGVVKLANPFASDKGYMRTSLREGVTKSIEQGIKNMPLLGVSQMKLFEIGNVFTEDGEHIKVTIGIGSDDQKKNKKSNYFDLEEIIKDVFLKLGLGEKGYADLGPNDDHIYQNHTTGSIKSSTTVEFSLSKLIQVLPDPKEYDFKNIDSLSVVYQTPSMFPFVLRDIALWVPEELSDSEVSENIKKEGGALLKRTDVFDTYAKEGKISYAFHLVFQSDEKTLTDDEVNVIMNDIEKMAENNSWEVR
jgi:phenylalanyl-tRNA synthetase beta subunit